MKVKYTIVYEVEGFEEKDDDEVELVGSVLANHGKEGSTDKRQITVKSCHAVVTKEMEVKV